MQASILGPLTLRMDGTNITPSAPKLRKLLAFLLINADRIVPVSSLIKELWEDEPPQSAQTTLQTYILHLRRLISQTYHATPYESARDILATGVGGYTFRVQPGELDLHLYNRLAIEGKCALASCQWQTAAELLTSALALWRGPTLVDVQAGSMLQPIIAGLDEARFTLTEQAIEASLRLGRHQEVLSDLTALVAEHRFHENLHAQLMLALHRCGRRQDALAIFQQLRSSLDMELGLEPSRPLHILQSAILSDDPVLREWSAGVPTGSAI